MDKEKNGEEGQIKQKINIILTRYFKWLVVLCVLVVLAVGYFFLLKPKYEKVVKLSEDGQTGREEEYLERREYLDKLENLVSVFRGVKASEIEKIDYILKKKDVPEELFSQVDAIAKKNGLLLESMKIGLEGEASEESGQKISRAPEGKIEASLPPEMGKTKVTLKVLGVDYFSLKNLLASIENNLILMNVVNVDFSPVDNAAQLTILSYYLKE
ncbi:MAG: hypothetical protein PHR36_02850 [Patescibacteria group bacterium]|nr:hypothetical protein [Patescibacteria group bacterium]